MNNPKLPIDISVLCNEPLIANALHSLLNSISDNVILNMHWNVERDFWESCATTDGVFVIYIGKNNAINTLDIIHSSSDFKKAKTIAIIPHNNHLFSDILLNSGVGGLLSTNASPSQLREAILAVNQCKRFVFVGNSNSDHRKHGYSRNTKLNETYKLCDREIKFLQLCCTNMSYKEIGDTLSISKRTAEHFAERLWQKLGYSSRIELIIFALSVGIFSHSNHSETPNQ